MWLSIGIPAGKAKFYSNFKKPSAKADGNKYPTKLEFMDKLPFTLVNGYCKLQGKRVLTTFFK